MQAKRIFVSGVLIVVVVAAGMVLVAYRSSVQTNALKRGDRLVETTPQVILKSDSAVEAPATGAQPTIGIQARRVEVAGGDPLPPSASRVGGPAKGKPPIQDPAARVALSRVGADSDAEEYWYYAINDPTLPAHERKDLIEDLNEDGLTDPEHPQPEDMPVIWSRIQLIETLAPYAMDDVNADAFAEAYKDLLNLAGGQRAQ